MNDFPEEPWVTAERGGLVGRVYDLAMPVHLGHYDPSELAQIAPDRLYVVQVEYILSNLVRRVESLNWVPKLLTASDLPLQTRYGSLSRADWLKICIDVQLTRLTSVRDCCHLLTARVFELSLSAREASGFKVLRSPEVAGGPALSLLQEVGSVGAALREERNALVHRGEERRLGPNHTMFKLAARFEAFGQPPANQGELPREDGTGTFELTSEHREIAFSLLTEHLASAHRIEAAVTDLLDFLYGEFETRFRSKYAKSKLGPYSTVEEAKASGRWPRPPSEE